MNRRGVIGTAFAVLPDDLARGLVARGAVAADVQDDALALDERPRCEAPLGHVHAEFGHELLLVNHLARRQFQTKEVARPAQVKDAVAVNHRRAGGAALEILVAQRRGVTVLPKLLARRGVEAPQGVLAFRASVVTGGDELATATTTVEKPRRPSRARRPSARRRAKLNSNPSRGKCRSCPARGTSASRRRGRKEPRKDRETKG